MRQVAGTKNSAWIRPNARRDSAEHVLGSGKLGWTTFRKRILELNDLPEGKAPVVPSRCRWILLKKLR